jgi:hypothetical protein
VTSVRTILRDRRDPERGSVMLLVSIILIALLSGGAIALYIQMSSNKQVGFTSTSRASLYCAESGLAEARATIGAFYSVWNDILDTDPANDPPWYPIRGDIDDPKDGVTDFEVTVRDNDDEPTSMPNDPTHDNDLKIFIISKCTKYPDAPREVLELVVYDQGQQQYRNQAGQGSGNTGNAN